VRRLLAISILAIAPRVLAQCQCPAASFGPAAAFFFSGLQPQAAAAADFNGDGVPDLAVADSGADDVSILLGTGDGAFGPPVRFAAGTRPWGVASADFDLDGHADLAVADLGGASVKLLFGAGDGTFGRTASIAVGAQPSGIAAADLDGDGYPDLVVADYGGAAVTVLRNLGDGTFSAAPPLSTLAAPYSVLVADFNGDGNPDVAVAEFGAGSVAIFLGVGDATFLTPIRFTAGVSPSALAAADLDGDGILDLAVVDTNGNVTRTFHGVGDGTFSPGATLPGGSGPSSVAVADLDLDGRPDLAVSNINSDDVTIFPAASAGTFAAGFAVPGGRGPTAIVAADWNRDGRPDLAVIDHGSANANGSPSTVVLLLSGAGGRPAAGFSSSVFLKPEDVIAADFNGDGKLDLAVASYGDGNNPAATSILLGRGDGTFSPAVEYPTGVKGRSIVAADFNGDGRLDLAVTNGGDDDVSILLGNGDGTFSNGGRFPAGLSPYGIAAADLNGDGTVDLVVTELFAKSPDPNAGISVLLGDGRGGFSAPNHTDTSGNAVGLVLADFDRDGRLDAAVTGLGGTVTILPGNGDGTFGPPTDYAVDPGTYGIAAGDFDGDGVLDLVVTAASPGNAVSFLRGLGGGGFQLPVSVPVGVWPVSVEVGDFNGDSLLDFVTADLLSGGISVVLGNGDGTFRPAVGFVTGANPFSVVAADFNRDGRPDLAVVQLGPGANGPSDVRALLNSNCLSRRLAFAAEPPHCASPGEPLAPAPAVAVQDDGGNLVTCDAQAVGASIVPGTGTAGARLTGTIAVSTSAGIATFPNLAIDRDGSGYRLAFAHPLAGTIRSGAIDIAGATILGPDILCGGASAVYSTARPYDSYAWFLDGAAVSSSATVSIGPLSAGTHRLTLSAVSGVCPASGLLDIEAAPNLSEVKLTLQGAAQACASGSGGLVSATDVGGGGSARQWGLRTVSGGPTTPIPAATAATYRIEGADFPGPGNYFLLCTATPRCGSPIVSPELAVTILAGAGPATPAIVAPVSAPAYSSGLPASVAVHAGSTYAWTVTGGGITSGQGSAAITFSTGSPGILTLECIEIDAAGCASRPGSAVVEVHAPGRALLFHTISPCRLVDTRRPPGPGGGPALTGGTTRDFVMAGGCGIPMAASAVAANVTAVLPSALGDLRIYPAGTPPPGSSVLNFRAGRTRANDAVLALASPSGAVTVRADLPGGSTNLILDVVGYFE
jgi:hypothetical protein